MRNSIQAVTACMLAACSVFAEQAPKTITAGEVVRQSLEHSHQLKIAGQNILANKARQSQVRAARLPSLSLHASAANYSGLEDVALGPQIVIPGIEERYRWAAEITQPLYTGGRLDAHARAARLFTESAEASLSAVGSDLQLEALTAYWTWAKAVWVLDSIKASVTRMEAHTADIRNRHDSGAATENDVASAETMLAQAELKLGDAIRNVELARARIASMTGHELPDGAIPSRPENEAAAKMPAEGDLIDRAMSGRLERKSAELTARASELQVKSEKSSYLPKVALVARYEEANPNSQFFPPADEWNSDVFVGVNLQWDLFESGGGRARIEEAAAKANIARERVASLDEAIKLEVRAASIQLASSLSRCKVAHKVEDSARRNLKSAETLWHSGSVRHSELLAAEAQFSSAQYDTAASEANAAIARAVLEHALGQVAE